MPADQPPGFSDTPPSATIATEPAAPSILGSDHVEQSKGFFREAMAEQGDSDQSTIIENDITQTPPPPAPAKPAKVADAPPSAIEHILPPDLLNPQAEQAPEAHPAIAEIDGMQLPKSAKTEAVANFNKLKEHSKKVIGEQQAKLADLEKQLGERNGNGTTPPELEALQTKLTAAEERAQKLEEDFARANFEKSPRFQQQFTEAETAALEGAKAYLEGTEIKPEMIDLAARASGQKRLQILREAGADPELLAAIVPHLATYDTVQRGKTKALENWKIESAKWNENQNQEAQQVQTRRRAEEDRVWDSVLNKVDLLPLKKSKENTEWNSRGDTLKTEAKQIFNGEGVPLDVLAETIVKGRAYDVLDRDVVQPLLQQNKILRSENAKLKSSRPGGTITVGSPESQVTNGAESPGAIFNRELAKAGAGGS